MILPLETDYLVIGAGAVAMAFVDELLHRDRRAHVVLVERRATPGGHWNDAYPFVRLHQPALYYGVNSEPLGDGGEDLVSKAQILGYYDLVLRKLLRTGRLVFLPQSHHEGEGRVRSLVAPDRVHEVRFRRRLVDGTYTGITVPSTTPPRYDVDEGVDLVPINGIAALTRPRRRYVVVGAGKTGMDAALHLLDQGVAPDAISWVVSRDAWLIDRAQILPKTYVASVAAQTRRIATARSVEDLCLALEEEGFFHRLDPGRLPTMYRCATVSREELARLRSIGDVLRLGRVRRIAGDRLHLDGGAVPVAPDTLFVDCTADGLVRRAPVPTFAPGRITLQPVMVCQPAFSGALIARVETLRCDDDEKNLHCRPVPHPTVPADLPGALLPAMSNLRAWARALLPWLLRSRLNAGSHAGLWRNLVLVARTLRFQKKALANLRRLSAGGAEAGEGTAVEAG